MESTLRLGGAFLLVLGVAAGIGGLASSSLEAVAGAALLIGVGIYLVRPSPLARRIEPKPPETFGNSRQMNPTGNAGGTIDCPICGAKGLVWAENALGVRYLVDRETRAEHRMMCPGVGGGGNRDVIAADELDLAMIPETQAESDTENEWPVPVTLSVDAYKEATTEAAMDFAESIAAALDLSDEKKWIAERELSVLYLVALYAWLEKLAPNDKFDSLMSECCSYIGAGAVPEDQLEVDGALSKAATAMEAVFRDRAAEYGQLALARPLSASAALARSFAVRLRAELGAPQVAETVATASLRNAPDLHADGVARRLLALVDPDIDVSGDEPPMTSPANRA